MPKVMAVPMSYRDIQPILEKLGGPAAPKEWQGALPIEYRLGGEAATLHVKVDMQTDVQPNYVVEGRHRGQRRCPTSGSCSATTTTPGSSAASTRAAAPPP